MGCILAKDIFNLLKWAFKAEPVIQAVDHGGKKLLYQIFIYFDGTFNPMHHGNVGVRKNYIKCKPSTMLGVFGN